MPPQCKRQPSNFETSLVNFGNKSKEQVSSLLRKARDSISHRKASHGFPNQTSGNQGAYGSEYPPSGYETTVLKRSNSDPDVTATLKSILKGKKGKRKAQGYSPMDHDYPEPVKGQIGMMQDERMDLKALAQQYNYDLPPRPTRRKGSLTHHQGLSQQSETSLIYP